MLKNICLFSALLLGSHLSAESIGNVEFQFPPSNYEWKIFMDHQSANAFFSSDSLDAESSDEEDSENCPFKLFAHREGDALEFFVALQCPKGEDDEDAEMDTIASVQKELDESVNRFFPNHRINLLDLKDLGDEGFLEYGLNDGSVDLMHGYARCFLKDQSLTILLYLSSALPTEYSRTVWTQVLNNAR